ncbi:zinc ion binding / nucleic acid binding protein, partial [Thalictrum thalictroides]
MEEMRARAAQQWALSESFIITPLAKGFLHLKFENGEDYQKVWTRGPWKFGNELLRLQKWEKNFRPENQKRTNALVWIRLPNLPMECWDEEVLLSIGRGVGYPMKVDDTSINKQYGYYVDLTKPIPDQILVSTEDYEFWQDVVVTKIPKFCNHCKIVGHSVTECRKLKGVLDKGKDPIVDNTPKDQTEKATKNTKRNKGKKVADHTTKEWMEKKNNEQDSFAAEISKSNSFQVLQEEEEAYEEPQQQLAVVTVEPVMGEVEPLAIAVEKTQNDTIQVLEKGREDTPVLLENENE